MRNQPDERWGLPSASKRHIYRGCAGSYFLERTAKDRGIKDPPSEAAQFGINVHAWLEGKDIQLTPEELLVAKDCEALGGELLLQWKPNALESPPLIVKEHRSWLLDGRGSPIFSGRADLVAVDGPASRALIIDYKSGPEEVDTSDNPQLLALAVMARDDFGVDEVTTAIVQPPHRPSPCVYDAATLDTAKAMLIAEVSMLLQADFSTSRTPGIHCKYCRGKTLCPEFKGYAWGIVEYEPGYLVQPAVLAQLFDRCAMAEAMIDKIKGAIRDLLTANPDALKEYGIFLKPGKERRSVADIKGFLQAMEDNGYPLDSFASALDVSLPALQDWCHTTLGIKRKDAKDFIESKLRGLIEVKQDRPSIVKK